MKEHVALATTLMQAAHGKDISMYDMAFVDRTLEKRKARAGAGSMDEYLAGLRSNINEACALQDDLMVTYSEFFRSPLSFAMLEKVVLPAVMEQKKNNGGGLRVWSAGCAAGQEAYSIAILLEEQSKMYGNLPPYHVTGTDINEKALACAREGVYDEQTLDKIRVGRLRTFFESRGSTYRINASIREKVDFSTYDVLDQNSTIPPAAVFGGFDLILCCNLLYYYRCEMQKIIAAKLRKALAAGGYLVVDDSEKDIIQRQPGFNPLCAYHAIFSKIG